MFRPQFLVIIRPYMNTSQVIKYMEYGTDPCSYMDYCVANMSWNYFLKVQLRLRRLKRCKTMHTRLQFMSKKGYN
jgi:hypothetical protein